jgi:hypothetical protein
VPPELPPSRIDPPVPAVSPLDPVAPPAPLVLAVDPVAPLDVVSEPPCPEPVLVALAPVVDPLPVGPVVVVASVEPVVAQLSTLGSHLALPFSAQPTNADPPSETMNPTPQEMRSKKLGPGMCFLSA